MTGYRRVSDRLLVCCSRYAGILSAYGMALADVVSEHQLPFAGLYAIGMYVTLDILVPDWPTKLNFHPAILFCRKCGQD